jgi:hypothetical protein
MCRLFEGKLTAADRDHLPALARQRDRDQPPEP